MNIYSFPTFNVTKILITAEEAQTPYTLHLMNPMTGDHKLPEHLARHPLGKVPAIELDGRHYFESNAICRLIAEKFAPNLYADTPEQRAEINLWMDFMAQHIGRWLSVPFLEEVMAPAVFDRPSNTAAIAEAKQFLDEQLPVLDAQLQGRTFLADNRLSIADAVGGSYFETVDYSSVDLDPYPNIQRWLDTLRARPSYVNAVAQLPGGKTFGLLDQL